MELLRSRQEALLQVLRTTLFLIDSYTDMQETDVDLNALKGDLRVMIGKLQSSQAIENQSAA
jgi:hypothetical protein